MNVNSPHPIDPALAEESCFGQMRAEPRVSMFLLATMARPNGAQMPIKVRNLSAGGMMAECPAGFVRDEPVVIHLRGIGPIEGRVAWVAGTRVGVAFELTIDPKLARTPVAIAPQFQLVQAARSAWRPAVR